MMFESAELVENLHEHYLDLNSAAKIKKKTYILGYSICYWNRKFWGLYPLINN